MTTSDIPSEIAGNTISEMWDIDYGWKWDIFTDLIPSNMKKVTASHSLFPGTENEVHIIWVASTSSKLSIKSRLSIIRVSISEDKDPMWRLIW